MDALLLFVVVALLSVWAVFWLIRLAVRYGVDDALQRNRDWLERSDSGAERR